VAGRVRRARSGLGGLDEQRLDDLLDFRHEAADTLEAIAGTYPRVWSVADASGICRMWH
jgi:hypothetical protein